MLRTRHLKVASVLTVLVVAAASRPQPAQGRTGATRTAS